MKQVILIGISIFSLSVFAQDECSEIDLNEYSKFALESKCHLLNTALYKFSNYKKEPRYELIDVKPFYSEKPDGFQTAKCKICYSK